MIDILIKEINKNYTDSLEFKRLFFGRGGAFEGLEFLNVDNIGNVIYVEIFKKNLLEKDIVNYLKDFAEQKNRSLLVKKRYDGSISGNLTPKYAIENNLKFLLDFSKQNIGFFGDIKYAREYLKDIAKEKAVLNLFSYTCAFSLYARVGGAKKIVNVDINRGVLKTGLKNHQINNIDTTNISFLNYDILSSFNRLSKKIKADIVIIDPPSMQSSFNIFKHYKKIADKLNLVLNENAIIIATANHPNFTKEDLLNCFKNYKFIKEIQPAIEYKNSSLKIAVFSL